MAREKTQYERVKEKVETLRNLANNIEESTREYASTSTNIGEGGATYSGTVADRVSEALKLVHDEMVAFYLKCEEMSKIVDKSAANIQATEEQMHQQVENLVK